MTFFSLFSNYILKLIFLVLNIEAFLIVSFLGYTFIYHFLLIGYPFLLPNIREGGNYILSLFIFIVIRFPGYALNYQFILPSSFAIASLPINFLYYLLYSCSRNIKTQDRETYQEDKIGRKAVGYQEGYAGNSIGLYTRIKAANSQVTKTSQILAGMDDNIDYYGLQQGKTDILQISTKFYLKQRRIAHVPRSKHQATKRNNNDDYNV